MSASKSAAATHPGHSGPAGHAAILNMVETFCSGAGLPPPDNPDIPNWDRLAGALRDGTSLLSATPWTYTEFKTYDQVLPQTTADRSGPVPTEEGEGDVEQCLARMRHYIRHMRDDAALTPRRPAVEYHAVPRLEYYTSRHGMVSRMLRWVDDEAAPIISALVERERGESERYFAVLDIPGLQCRLRTVRDAYAAELGRAREMHYEGTGRGIQGSGA